MIYLWRIVRSISSDRGKVVAGSDDQFVLVWDKQTTHLVEELKGHDAQVWLEYLLIYYPFICSLLLRYKDFSCIFQSHF